MQHLSLNHAEEHILYGYIIFLKPISLKPDKWFATYISTTQG